MRHSRRGGSGGARARRARRRTNRQGLVVRRRRQTPRRLRERRPAQRRSRGRNPQHRAVAEPNLSRARVTGSSCSGRGTFQCEWMHASQLEFDAELRQCAARSTASRWASLAGAPAQPGSQTQPAGNPYSRRLGLKFVCIPTVRNVLPGHSSQSESGSGGGTSAGSSDSVEESGARRLLGEVERGVGLPWRRHEHEDGEREQRREQLLAPLVEGTHLVNTRHLGVKNGCEEWV